MKNRRFMFNGTKVPRHEMKVTTFLANEEMGLLDFILKKLDGISRNKAKGLLSHELVKVDGRIEKQYNFEVKPNMVIEVTKNPRFMPMKNFDRFFAILYEDEYLNGKRWNVKKFNIIGEFEFILKNRTGKYKRL